MKLDGWVPIGLSWPNNEQAPKVDWCQFGETRFADPFFSDTVRRRMNHPFHHAFPRQTPMEALHDWRLQSPGVPPAGFIFHMSRCGSTLIGRMLAAPDRNMVLSEAAPLDIILRSHLRDASIGEEQRIEWLRDMVSALGQCRGGKEKHLFIKFDCWNIVELPLVQRAFPGVPILFVYRDPIAVLASHLRVPGAWTLPSIMPPETLGLPINSAGEMPHREYLVRVLARVLELAVSYHGRFALLMNYSDLPGAVCSSLLRCCKLDYDPADLDRMREVSLYNAKAPSLRFEADEEKRKIVSPELRELSARWIEPYFRQLEHARNLTNDEYAFR